MRLSLVCAVLASIVLSGPPAQALESYPADVTDQFMSWCSRDQGQPQTICSCALGKAALEIPASAMASFLSAAEGGGMAATASGIGATTVSIFATCASAGGSSGTAGGSLLKSLGQ
ncbi:MAG: hypothetical protein ISR45_06125 [Rhodospirillales bacterium]|nr:hypothetical protein [Rhodospirillales bacterium]